MFVCFLLYLDDFFFQTESIIGASIAEEDSWNKYHGMYRSLFYKESWKVKRDMIKSMKLLHPRRVSDEGLGRRALYCGLVQRLNSQGVS